MARGELVIDLPRHLSQWGPQLALFPKELALALGPLVSRLANLVGGWRVAETHDGDPDGYDGIARRGTYDRLLPTEWLLLDEIPEEFVRRVVAGEHAFLRRAQRASVGERRCLALFDAGSDQLGTPRLAHLALLVLLARRADEQRATLEWGVLQDPELALRTGLTRSSVLHLVRAGCGRTVSPSDFDRWVEVAQRAKGAEIWLIGANAVAPQASRFHASVVLVSDVIEPNPPQRIRVRVSDSRAAVSRADVSFSKEVILDVPSDPLAVQLLRDPFAARGASRQVAAWRVDVNSNLVFAADGRRLYARGAASTLVTLQVPNSPHATPGPTTAFNAPDGHTILAAGRLFSRKRTVVVSQLGQELFLHVLSRSGSSATQSLRFTPSSGYTLPTPSATRLSPVGVLEPNRFYFLDPQGRVVELVDGSVQPRENFRSIAARALRDCFAWVVAKAGSPQILWVRTNKEGQVEMHQSLLPGANVSLDSASFRFGVGVSEAYAYMTALHGWVIANERSCTRVSVPEQAQVVGLVKLQAGRPEVGLLVLDASDTRIQVLQSGELKTLFTSGAGIAGVEVSGTGLDVAYLTESGELGVYSCTVNAIVARLQAEMLDE
ncbi:MAG TPA: hypothetical protein VFQ61_18925 [Polyangiaceae bacterium]|nr:hypothetical protein [Polyangiaceae bacterium]